MAALLVSVLSLKSTDLCQDMSVLL